MFTDVPSFHDGYLVGIKLLDTEIRLSLVRTNGERWEITFTGVERLQIEDFREGNIISCFNVIHKTRPEKDLLERLFPGPHPTAAQHYLDSHSLLLEKKADLVEADQAAVISIIPSYGADLVAFVSGISATCLNSKSA